MKPGEAMQRYEQEQREEGSRGRDDGKCECGAELVWAECHMIDCWDGEYDLGDEDPINYAEGTWVQCGECDGKGGNWLCADPDRHRGLIEDAAEPPKEASKELK